MKTIYKVHPCREHRDSHFSYTGSWLIASPKQQWFGGQEDMLFINNMEGLAGASPGRAEARRSDGLPHAVQLALNPIQD